MLEAVRVSRAGYPTRYPHHQFMSRYYMLGDLGQDGTKRNKDMVQLVKFLSKHVWEADLKKSQARDELKRQQTLENVRLFQISSRVSRRCSKLTVEFSFAQYL